METGRVKVFRYDPEQDRAPRYETFEYPFVTGMSVLDVALYIFEKIDGTFSFSYCCRNSHCGLCGAKINGKPGLMCRESAFPEMTIEPLDNLAVVRDIMVDLNQYEEQMLGMRLFLERTHKPAREPEKINMQDHHRFKVVSRCVKCYNCLSVCTAFSKNPHEFLGPAAIVQLCRHVFDPRDELSREIIAYGAGTSKCTLCDKCTFVCPHGISPRESIEIIEERLKSNYGVPNLVRRKKKRTKRK